jgi:hypothetical protein
MDNAGMREHVDALVHVHARGPDDRRREVPQGELMRRLILLCALLAGCYEPESVDCTIECSAADQCAEGQVCGPDHFCADPDVAGTCGAMNSDEPHMVSLAITIQGEGKVSVEHVGTCDSKGPTQGSCMFNVTAGMARQLEAIAGKDREFVSWTSTCTGTSSTCSLTPVMSLTHVGAKFE